MKECDERNSLISSDLHLISIMGKLLLGRPFVFYQASLSSIYFVASSNEIGI